ncbi:MAG: flagellar filament capping protein FliD [Bryobacterales bacterium]|nr:flagellar filament capping protein FliD [Bryobacterales bacterium]
MSITPLKFTGISTYSSDFQKIVDRAVSIASMPIKQMQNQQSDLILKKQSLTALNGTLQTFAGTVKDLASMGDTHAISVSSSNTSKVTVQMTGNAAATSYTITDITSVARRASESTVAGFADKDTTHVDADGQLQLVIGTEKHNIDLASYGNNLNGLVEAINDLDAGVHASILNTGSGTEPYHLSLVAENTGSTTLQLRGTADDANTNVLTATNQGANAKFKLNGLQMEKSDNTISDSIEGITYNILDTTDADESIVIGLSTNRGTLATKLTAFVNAYNAAMGKVNSNIGENAGMLSGDSIIGTTQRALRSVANYTASSGTIKSLMDLGIELDKTGTMSFDSSKFYSLSSSKITAAFDFFGSATTGFGATFKTIDAISNAYTGTIAQQQAEIDRTDRRLTDQIATISGRIQIMQESLNTKLQLADGLLSQLQGQQTMLDSTIKSLETSTYGKN